MRYVLSLDQGTNSSRALLIDEKGVVAGWAQRSIALHHPAAGRFEQDATEIWNTSRKVVEQVLNDAGVQPSELVGLAIASQRESALLWDRQTGEPLGPVISWLDQRALPEDCLEPGERQRVTTLTGLPVDPYFSAPKWVHLLAALPDGHSRALHGEIAAGTIDSWLLWNFTGRKMHATDPSNAHRTLLADLESGQWSPDLLQAFGLPAPLLPEIIDSAGHLATVADGSLLDGLPIIALVGDQQAALFGMGGHQPGRLACTYGAGSFALAQTGDRPVRIPNGPIPTIAWQIDGKREYALEGSIFSGCSLVSWLQTHFGIIGSPAEISRLAEEADPRSETLFVPAAPERGSPRWDSEGPGGLWGVGTETARAEFARAILEAVALQTTTAIEAVIAALPLPAIEIRAGGGAAENNWLLQCQADLLQKPVHRAEVSDGTALGAAFLGGLAVGFWPHRQKIDALWAAQRTFVPQRKAADVAQRRARWRRAIDLTSAFARPENA